MENKRILLVGRSDKQGEPSPFKYDVSVFEPEKGNQVVLRIRCFSIDPVMRVWMSGAETYFPAADLDQPFHTFGVGQVVSSNTSLYKKGDLLFGNTSCSQYISISDQPRLRTLMFIPQELIAGFSPQEFLYLTNNGLTAFEGIEIMGAKQGDTVVVSTAAGATGLLVCQILKYRGVKVVGLTSQSKVKAIEKYCDVALDYKDHQKLVETLKAHKFKYYFDNVGQWLLDLVLKYIQPNGTISLCGATANYRNFKEREGVKNYGLIVSKRLTLKGFNFSMAIMKIFEAYDYFRRMKKAGKLDLYIEEIRIEDFTKGYEKLLGGGNIGKIIVSEPPTSRL